MKKTLEKEKRLEQGLSLPLTKLRKKGGCDDHILHDIKILLELMGCVK